MKAAHAPDFKQQYATHLKRLRLQGLQPKTIDACARAIRDVGAYFQERIDDLTEAQLTEYFTDQLQTHSWSTLKHRLYGLRFYDARQQAPDPPVAPAAQGQPGRCRRVLQAASRAHLPLLRRRHEGHPHTTCATTNHAGSTARWNDGMPGDVTDTAIVSAGNIGIRKPRITRARKRLSGRIKGYENRPARTRDRSACTSESNFSLDHRPPRLIGK